MKIRVGVLLLSFLMSSAAWGLDKSIPLPAGEMQAAALNETSGEIWVVVSGALFRQEGDRFGEVCKLEMEEAFLSEEPYDDIQDAGTGDIEARPVDGRWEVLFRPDATLVAGPTGVWEIGPGKEECRSILHPQSFGITDAVLADQGVLLVGTDRGLMRLGNSLSMTPVLRTVSDGARRVAALSPDELLVSSDGGNRFERLGLGSLSIYGKPLDALWLTDGLLVLSSAGLWKVAPESRTASIRPSPPGLRGIAKAAGRTLGWTDNAVVELREDGWTRISIPGIDRVMRVLDSGSEAIAVLDGMVVPIPPAGSQGSARPEDIPGLDLLIASATAAFEQDVGSFDCPVIASWLPVVEIGARYETPSSASIRPDAPYLGRDEAGFGWMFLVRWSIGPVFSMECEALKKKLTEQKTGRINETTRLWSRWNDLNRQPTGSSAEVAEHAIEIEEIKTRLNVMSNKEDNR